MFRHPEHELGVRLLVYWYRVVTGGCWYAADAARSWWNSITAAGMLPIWYTTFYRDLDRRNSVINALAVEIRHWRKFGRPPVGFPAINSVQRLIHNLPALKTNGV